MSFWRKSKSRTELAIPSQKAIARELGKSAPTTREASAEPVKLTRVDDGIPTNLDQRIKELMRRDGSNMRDFWSSWELQAALEERRRLRQLNDMDVRVRLAKGELELGKLEVDRLHEKDDEYHLRAYWDGETAYAPKRRR